MPSERLKTHGWDPGRAALFIDSRNSFNEVDRQNILDSGSTHAPGIARCVHMVYGCAPSLVTGRYFIRLLQGKQQGDPPGMFLLSLVIQALVDELQKKFTLDLNIWCAYDGTLIGPIKELVKAMATLKDMGSTIGYHLDVGKSNLWWPTVKTSNTRDALRRPYHPCASSLPFPRGGSIAVLLSPRTRRKAHRFADKKRQLRHGLPSRNNGAHRRTPPFR